jgi:hypothetical protein
VLKVSFSLHIFNIGVESKRYFQHHVETIRGLLELMELDQCHYAGAIWARKLVNTLWTIIWAQWDSRNADRHGHTPEESQSIRRERLAQQVTTQYQMAPLMKATDRTLVAEPIEQKMQKSLGSIALWLQHTRPTIRLSTDAVTQAISRTHA